jgi:hypothetical protein
MSDPEYEEKQKHREQEMDAMNTFIREHMTCSVAREERGIELLEQISKQLNAIESLLRERGSRIDH